MSNKRQDIFELLAKLAPDAKIELRVRELRMLLRHGAKKIDGGGEDRPLVHPEPLRHGTASIQADVFRTIRELWPNTSVTKLCQAIGVSRAWLYKTLESSQTPTAAPKLSDLETFGEVYDFFNT